MLRSGAARSLARSVLNARQAHLASALNAPSSAAYRSLSFRGAVGVRALAPYKPMALALVRHATYKTSDSLEEKLQQKLKPAEDGVSTTSSVRPALEGVGERDEDNVDMMAGIRGDMVGWLAGGRQAGS